MDRRSFLRTTGALSALVASGSALNFVLNRGPEKAYSMRPYKVWYNRDYNQYTFNRSFDTFIGKEGSSTYKWTGRKGITWGYAPWELLLTAKKEGRLQKEGEEKTQELLTRLKSCGYEQIFIVEEEATWDSPPLCWTGWDLKWPLHPCVTDDVEFYAERTGRKNPFEDEQA